jgi:uncharacterized protein
MAETSINALDDESDRTKTETARRIVESLAPVVVAFSAGVDSTFLLALAVNALGSSRVLAVMGVSPSLPAREREAGRRLARGLGARLVEVATGEMTDPRYSANPANRCYYCKEELFTRLGEIAVRHGFRTVVCGANADDTGDYRPGLAAARRMGVRSPLAEAGLTKQDVRLASRAMGLETWDKPAMACLASRVPYGEAITTDRLARIERSEYVLKDLGFTQCRVRDHGSMARIEVPAGEIAMLLRLRGQILQPLRALGYAHVAVDLAGFRSGSMNEMLTQDPILTAP